LAKEGRIELEVLKEVSCQVDALGNRLSSIFETNFEAILTTCAFQYGTAFWLTRRRANPLPSAPVDERMSWCHSQKRYFDEMYKLTGIERNLKIEGATILMDWANYVRELQLKLQQRIKVLEQEHGETIAYLRSEPDIDIPFSYFEGYNAYADDLNRVREEVIHILGLISTELTLLLAVEFQEQMDATPPLVTSNTNRNEIGSAFFRNYRPQMMVDPRYLIRNSIEDVFRTYVLQFYSITRLEQIAEELMPQQSLKDVLSHAIESGIRRLMGQKCSDAQSKGGRRHTS
jgi:hypothetical protein